MKIDGNSTAAYRSPNQIPCHRYPPHSCHVPRQKCWLTNVLTSHSIPVPKLMIENANIPALPAAVAATSLGRARIFCHSASIQVSTNCNTVYDAICATVGAARSNSSTNGRRSTSSLGSDCNILVPPISPCQAKQKTPKPPLQGFIAQLGH